MSSGERAKLVEENLDVARRAARRFRHLPLEQDDLAQEAALGLIGAARRYDPSRGVPFAAYASSWVNGRLLDLVRRRARRDRLEDGAWVTVASLERLRENDGYEQRRVFEPADPRGDVENARLGREALALLGELPPTERLVLIRTVLDGATAAEVGDELGVSAHQVYSLAESGSRRLRRRAA